MKQWTFKEYQKYHSYGSINPVADLGDVPYTPLAAEKQNKLTKGDVDQVEKYADRLFASLNVDVELTKHFMNRVNDARNVKQISAAELVRLFKQAYKKYGKKISKLPDQTNAVINDMKTDINMPFIVNINSKGEIELVVKTIIRKKNFTTSGIKFSFEGFRIGMNNVCR